MLSCADEFAGEDAGFLCGLLGLGGVALGAAVCGDNEGFGLVLDDFE